MEQQQQNQIKNRKIKTKKRGAEKYLVLMSSCALLARELIFNRKLIQMGG